MKKLMLIVAILALAGGTGWFFYNKNNGSSTQNNNQQSASNTQSQSEIDQIPDPSEGGKYLVINEWGVRFRVPDELEESVRYEKSKVYDETGTILIHSDKINLTGSTCGNENGEVLALYRQDNREGEQTTPPNFKTIGDYSFFVSRCDDYGLDSVNESKINNLERSIKETLGVL